MARQSLKNVIRLINEVTEELPVEKSFLNDLKRSIELTADKNKRKGSQSYKPSSMNCLRQMYYIVTGQDPEPMGESYTGVGICNAGTDIHQRIQQYVLDMKSNNIDCEYVNVADFVRSRNLDYLDIVKEPDFENRDYETKLFHKTLNMSFLCDGIIKYKNKYYILELKTEASFKFNQRDGVDSKHYNQGTAYSLAFGLDSVLFLYISRDMCDMKAFMYVVSQEEKDSVKSDIELCESYVNKGEVPPKDENVPKKACTYCAYKQLCQAEV